MAKIRHFYPGGNTRYGFYSLYDHMVLPEVRRKIILKGGPGVGKSTFMKKIGSFFWEKGFNLEYHWCSSDDNSLDGLVIGDHKVCLLDGTAPHVVDPVYPGAVDEIVNLGSYWDRNSIKASKDDIIKLTREISVYFNLAYRRFKESGIAYDELKSYYINSRNDFAINKNIQALAADFMAKADSSVQKPRHLFAGAFTPGGPTTKIDSIIDENTSIFAVKGSPGSGFKELFHYVQNLIELTGVYAEIFHNPFDPSEIDLIILPGTNNALLDNSSNILAYENTLENQQYKRLLDFDKFLDVAKIAPFAKSIAQANDRLENGIEDAVNFIQAAKKAHDDLELFYIPSMNFEAVDAFREELQEEILHELKD